MPRTISTALQAHFGGDTYTLAMCWLLTRSDGMTLGFTSNVADLTIDGITYESKTSASVSAVEMALGSGINNLDGGMIFDSAGITEADLLGGIYDNCQVTVSIVNYEDLTQGQVILLNGTIGTVTVENGSFTAEFRSYMQFAQQPIVNVTSALCRADFGDSTCKYSGQIVYTPFTVTTAASNRQFAATGITQPDDFFSAGKVLWLTGQNAGQKMEIKRQLNAGGSVELQLAMPYPITVGDTFTLYRGCNKTPLQCQIYGNVINFQGEPHVPGRDAMLIQPK